MSEEAKSTGQEVHVNVPLKEMQELKKQVQNALSPVVMYREGIDSIDKMRAEAQSNAKNSLYLALAIVQQYS